MMLERLSKESVFGYEESINTGTHSDAIACVSSLVNRMDGLLLPSGLAILALPLCYWLCKIL
jgi:hypothetical protein